MEAKGSKRVETACAGLNDKWQITAVLCCIVWCNVAAGLDGPGYPGQTGHILSGSLGYLGLTNFTKVHLKTIKQCMKTESNCLGRQLEAQLVR